MATVNQFSGSTFRITHRSVLACANDSTSTPQEMALYIGFTIAETFRYFGWLTGIPKDELAVRTASLLKFLDLPPAHCVIGQLR